MAVFRYDTTGTWYKGNTHIHSTASDGGKTFAEIAALYHEQGYAFLFRTDHWVSSRVAEDEDAYPLLWLDGIELNGESPAGHAFHIVCLGACPALGDRRDLDAAVAAAAEAGALLVLAEAFVI